MPSHDHWQSFEMELLYSYCFVPSLQWRVVCTFAAEQFANLRQQHAPPLPYILSKTHPVEWFAYFFQSLVHSQLGVRCSSMHVFQQPCYILLPTRSPTLISADRSFLARILNGPTLFLRLDFRKTFSFHSGPRLLSFFL